MQRQNKDEETQITLQMKGLMADIRCIGNNPITRICDNPQCNNAALFCSFNDCQNCSKAHLDCRSYTFQKFTKLVQMRTAGPLSEFYQKCMQIQNKLIFQIQKNIRKFSHTFSIEQLIECMSKKHYKMIEQIFRNKNSQAIIGKQANQLFSCLQQTQITDESKQQELIDMFTDQKQRLLKQYLKVKELIFDSAYGRDKYTKKLKEKYKDELQVQSNALKMKNNIVRMEELLKSQNAKIKMFAGIIQSQLIKEDKKYIKNALSQPKKMQLIFRASQNNFSAQKFHKACDHVDGTFVILHNQYGQTFAGYTTLNWFGQKVFKEDMQSASFLLSLTSKTKMMLQNSSKAIYCSSNYGPTFGGSSSIFSMFNTHDLQIGDKCNQLSNSSINFPQSYKLIEATNQYSDRSKKPSTFKVLEYEVYRVMHDAK